MCNHKMATNNHFNNGHLSTVKECVLKKKANEKYPLVMDNIINLSIIIMNHPKMNFRMKRLCRNTFSRNEGETVLIDSPPTL